RPVPHPLPQTIYQSAAVDAAAAVSLLFLASAKGDRTMNQTTHNQTTNKPANNAATPRDDAALERLVRFYETLTPQSLAQIERLYAPDARFKDPFNDIRGLAAITRVFEHMYAQLHDPRF